MQGSIYRLVLTDKDDGKPHPHVIVLTFTGNRDCIAVPAYSTDGFKINENIERSRSRGLSDDKIFVRLDNAVDVDFTSSFPEKEAFWCVTLSRRLSQKFVSGSDRIGQMKLPAFRKICQTLLNWADTGESDLSPNAIKALRAQIKNLPDDSPA